MTLTIIISVIIIGLVLLLLEILVLPGIVVGIIGVCMVLLGLVSGYRNYGVQTGNYLLIGTLAASGVLLWFISRASTWKKVTLHSSVDGKVNTFDHSLIKAGDEGKTISRLAPTGKALINNTEVEVQSLDGFTDENKEIVVSKTETNKIFVKIKHS